MGNKIKKLSYVEYLNFFIKKEKYTILSTPSFGLEFFKHFPKVSTEKLFLFLYSKFGSPTEDMSHFKGLFNYFFEVSLGRDKIYICFNIENIVLDKNDLYIFVPKKFVKKDLKEWEKLYKKYFEEMVQQDIPVVVDTNFAYSYEKYFPFSEKVFNKNLGNFQKLLTKAEYKVLYDGFSFESVECLNDEEKKKRDKCLKILKKYTNLSKKKIEEFNPKAALVLFDTQGETFAISKYPKVQEAVNFFFEDLKKPIKKVSGAILKIC